MSQLRLLEMYAARSPYIDQGESHNVWVAAPTGAQLASYHFAAWRAGVKTGIYYLRTKPAAAAVKFTIAEAGRKRLRVADDDADADADDADADADGVKDARPAKRAAVGGGEEADAPLVCTRAMRDAGCEACSA